MKFDFITITGIIAVINFIFSLLINSKIIWIIAACWTVVFFILLGVKE